MTTVHDPAEHQDLSDLGGRIASVNGDREQKPAWTARIVGAYVLPVLAAVASAAVMGAGLWWALAVQPSAWWWGVCLLVVGAVGVRASRRVYEWSWAVQEEGTPVAALEGRVLAWWHAGEGSDGRTTDRQKVTMMVGLLGGAGALWAWSIWAAGTPEGSVRTVLVVWCKAASVTCLAIAALLGTTWGLAALTRWGLRIGGQKSGGRQKAEGALRSARRRQADTNRSDQE